MRVTTEGYLTKLSRVLGASRGIVVQLRQGAVPRTDGRRIVLPSFSDAQLEAIEKEYQKHGFSGIDVLHGFLDHETAHVYYTFSAEDAETLRYFRDDLAGTVISGAKGGLPEHLTIARKLLKLLANVIEDIRIEALWVRRFPGAAPLFFSFYRDELSYTFSPPKTPCALTRKEMMVNVSRGIVELRGTPWMREATAQRKDRVTQWLHPTLRKIVEMVSYEEVVALDTAKDAVRYAVPIASACLELFLNAPKVEASKEKSPEKSEKENPEESEEENTGPDEGGSADQEEGAEAPPDELGSDLDFDFEDEDLSLKESPGGVEAGDEIQEAEDELAPAPKFLKTASGIIESVPPEDLGSDPLKLWHTFSTEQDRLEEILPPKDPKLVAAFEAEVKAVSLHALGRHLLGEYARRFLPASEGKILNKRKLASFFTSVPELETAFLSPVARRERRNIIVQIIVDCSGSMHGEKIHKALLAAAALGILLDRLGIPFEIVGFTTEPQGFETRKKEPYFRQEGLHHYNFKSFAQPFSLTFPAFARWSELSIMEQNIDGESIATLSQRLLIRPEKRKILFVISDGYPLCRFTSAQYLSNHLKAVIRKLEKTPGLEVYGIGIDELGAHAAVEMFYSNCIRIDKYEELPARLLKLFLTGARRRKMA